MGLWPRSIRKHSMECVFCNKKWGLFHRLLLRGGGKLNILYLPSPSSLMCFCSGSEAPLPKLREGLISRGLLKAVCFGLPLICFDCLTPDPATMLTEIPCFATTRPLKFFCNGLWPSMSLLTIRWLQLAFGWTSPWQCPLTWLFTSFIIQRLRGLLHGKVQWSGCWGCVSQCSGLTWAYSFMYRVWNLCM